MCVCVFQDIQYQCFRGLKVLAGSECQDLSLLSVFVVHVALPVRVYVCMRACNTFTDVGYCVCRCVCSCSWGQYVRSGYLMGKIADMWCCDVICTHTFLYFLLLGRSRCIIVPWRRDLYFRFNSF